jgi:hypothetical protein
MMSARVALAAVAVAWVYETFAIVSRRRPTITLIVHRHRHRPLVEVGVCTFIGWLWVHLLVDGEGT